MVWKVVKELNMERDLPVTGNLPCNSQHWARLEQVTVDSSRLCTCVARAQTSGPFLLLSQAFNRELDQKWWSQDLNWYLHGMPLFTGCCRTRYTTTLAFFCFFVCLFVFWEELLLQERQIYREKGLPSASLLSKWLQ